MKNGDADADVEVLGADSNNEGDENAVQEPPHECLVVLYVQVPKADWAINLEWYRLYYRHDHTTVGLRSCNNSHSVAHRLLQYTAIRAR